MKNTFNFVIVFGVSILFSPFCLAQETQEKTQSVDKTEIANDATKTNPLELDAKVPEITLKDAQGEDIQLSSLYLDKPVVLVFFRGGWCPICTRHTGEIISAYPQIQELGAEVVAVSPDSPDSTKANRDKNSIPFQVLSDANVEAARAFGLAFTVDDGTVTKYKGFGIDLEKASGKTHHALPIPAVYIISTEGKVIFAHSDPDYRNRLKMEQILAKLKKL